MAHLPSSSKLNIQFLEDTFPQVFFLRSNSEAYLSNSMVSCYVPIDEYVVDFLFFQFLEFTVIFNDDHDK